jgi:hypothetical protein
VLEGRLFHYRFRARIEQQAELARVLDPAGQQTPSHQAEMPDAVFDDDDGYRLGRRNVMSWRETGLFEIAKNLPQRRWWRGDYEASAHSLVQVDIRSAPFNSNRQHCGR